MSDFKYEVEDGKVTVTRYTGAGGDVVVPDEIDGYPVNRIGSYAFQYDSNLTSVTLPNSLTTISVGAFAGCPAVIQAALETRTRLAGFAEGWEATGMEAYDDA